MSDDTPTVEKPAEDVRPARGSRISTRFESLQPFDIL
jgi:hypothetical protein